MPLNDDARLLIAAGKLAQLPPIQTLSAKQAREHFDARTEGVAVEPLVGEVMDRSIPGPAGDLPVRIYRPVDASSATPALLFFHGGGWVIGTIDTHDVVCRALTEASGATVVSVDYRLAPEHHFPAAIDDCEAATRWVAEHGHEVGIDGSRLAVCGDSAGGNLAAAVALSCSDGPLISAQALVYPVTDLSTDTRPSQIANATGYLLEQAGMAWFIDHYVPAVSDRTNPRCSPLLGALGGQPPAIVLTAEFDPLLDEGRAYAAALSEAGVEVEYDMIDGHVHTFFTQVGVVKASQEVVDRIAAFLNRHW